MAKIYQHKRFVRSKDPKSFRLQPRDVEILKLLAEYRLLDTYQLKELTSRAISNLRRRLQYLFHAGLVDRPLRQHDFLKPPRPMVYALGKKGAELLAEQLEIDRDKITWQSSREVRLPYIDHALMISNFRATLTLALRPYEDIVNLSSWHQGAWLKDRVTLESQRVTLVPDAFFTIAYSDDLHYFLEADRGTMTTKRYLQKLRVYWQWWRQGGHQQKFGIRRFRVLTLTASEKRKENLRVLAQQADDRKQGSAMFLFACEKAFDLQHPVTILQPIWQTPVDDIWYNLFE